MAALPPGHRPGVHRRRLLLPDLRRPAASGDHDHPDLARLRGVQEGRLQRARQVVRGRRGARQPGRGSTRTTTSAWSPRSRPRRTTRRRSASRSTASCRASGSRAPTSCSARSGWPAPARPSARRYGLTDGRRVVLYAPTFRGDSVTDAHATDDLDLALLRETLGEDHVLLVRLHPFVRSRTRDRPGARGLRDRRLRPSRHQRADARQRRPRHRLLERDLRVRAARPADGLLRPRLRGLRSRARLLLRLPDRASRGRSSRPPRRSRGTFEPGISTSSGWTASATRRSTSPMDDPRRASRTS